MCGRYDLHNHPGAIALAMGLPYPQDLIPRYNIAPMTDIPVVRIAADGAREMVMMRWGLVPRWAQDPSIGARMINARGETVATSKAFRIPFARHRCLIPADGFYEWQKLPDGRKQPVRIAMRDGRTFALAGLAERWLSPDGDVLDSCTIVTIDANALLAPVHARMPVIVPPDAYGRWLDASGDPPVDLLAPYPEGAMTLYPVSTRVNAVRNDDASLIAPVAADPRTEPRPPAAAAAADDPDSGPVQAALF
ncbi:MAG: SOS response-associated peptidase [Proteobacteria bacterium]|nr:SOS response-associated peptidase [Pseudomonadota bacterium]